jgi:hypothetical protein
LQVGSRDHSRVWPERNTGPTLLILATAIAKGSPPAAACAIVLTNQKGAVLELSGQQVGLIANADLSGLAITLK